MLVLSQFSHRKFSSNYCILFCLPGFKKSLPFPLPDQFNDCFLFPPGWTHRTGKYYPHLHSYGERERERVRQGEKYTECNGRRRRPRGLELSVTSRSSLSLFLLSHVTGGRDRYSRGVAPTPERNPLPYCPFSVDISSLRDPLNKMGHFLQ